ncbi:MAG: outer membrane lipoprotein-sorting protein [Flavobacteriaceae bacterium]|jgi:outer membrane lipoprotein-sorting protein|nr:outer membrane lipoprotein-sorting protein [Flavobacteriia bacterium]
MKHLFTLVLAVVLTLPQLTLAQDLDEILDNYFENTGGRAQWEALEGIKMTAKINQMGMEIPLEIIQLKSGKQMTVINFQGQQIKQGVFDGQVLWSINMMTQKAEKSDQETTDNIKREMGDFPDPFLNYQAKGYTAELLGTEEIDGAECYKIKLTKKPLIVDGQEVDNVSFYYFDMDNFVPIAVQSEIKAGPAKGQMSEVKMSDYQEVSGYYFPFSMIQGLKGQEGQAITFDQIEVNPQVDEAEFVFPEDAGTN